MSHTHPRAHPQTHPQRRSESAPIPAIDLSPGASPTLARRPNAAPLRVRLNCTRRQRALSHRRWRLRCSLQQRDRALAVYHDRRHARTSHCIVRVLLPYLSRVPSNATPAPDTSQLYLCDRSVDPARVPAGLDARRSDAALQHAVAIATSTQPHRRNPRKPFCSLDTHAPNVHIRPQPTRVNARTGQCPSCRLFSQLPALARPQLDHSAAPLRVRLSPVPQRRKPRCAWALAEGRI
ncbi:hypothetical protein B0H17DRAFT_4259 [Mycena rosella]|uniref:Uncharacterized protein n=1 Tax=Mycena rosella TaxID=1033263 RepID=A0AAD7H2D1_MYCRO|nr:hypothetical protein B0H17DRAFT_4259 [Mycena rosella]